MECDICGYVDRAQVVAFQQGFGAISDDAVAEIDAMVAQKEQEIMQV